jgi:hypothetical protein
MLTEGCVFPEPPTYREPEKTPPFLWGPIPATIQIHSVKSGDPFDINVYFRSEDAGDDIAASLFVNYVEMGQQSGFVGGQTIAAGTLAEVRTINIPWVVPESQSPGTCEQLSLLVTHRSNLNVVVPIDDSDVAMLTWWLNIDGTAETAGNCVQRSSGVSK